MHLQTSMIMTGGVCMRMMHMHTRAILPPGNSRASNARGIPDTFTASSLNKHVFVAMVLQHTPEASAVSLLQQLV